VKARSAKTRRPNTQPAALPALKRAARRAVQIARSTGTSAYVLENGKLVDAGKRIRRKRKKARPN